MRQQQRRWGDDERPERPPERLRGQELRSAVVSAEIVYFSVRLKLIEDSQAAADKLYRHARSLPIAEASKWRDGLARDFGMHPRSGPMDAVVQQALKGL